MRYVLRQKLFSWGDDFYVQDEQGQRVYFVDGKVFSLGDQLSLQDLEGNELAFIKVAEVSKRWFTLTDTYGVEVAEGEDDVLVLASTIVIDMACHPDDRGKRH